MDSWRSRQMLDRVRSRARFGSVPKDGRRSRMDSVVIDFVCEASEPMKSLRRVDPRREGGLLPQEVRPAHTARATLFVWLGDAAVLQTLADVNAHVHIHIHLSVQGGTILNVLLAVALVAATVLHAFRRLQEVELVLGPQTGDSA
eukprot:scaffold1465_cov383-Prasinococcus_capsulatus_cf.AAC.10